VPRATYVDAARCHGCHPAKSAQYKHTGMARGFSAVGRVPQIDGYDGSTIVHARSGRRYKAVRRADRLYQRRYELDARGRRVNEFELEATHVIGSGHHARTYLHRNSAGDLIELPLTWYSDAKSLGLSPGFDTAAPPDFTRIADESCLFCHNGYPSTGAALAGGIDASGATDRGPGT
jgi:hypothetical protein